MLIVTPEIGELRVIEEKFQALNNVEVLSLGQALSAHLLDFAQRKWAGETRKWMTAQCRQATAEWLVCAQIDLLFEPELMLDPLALFQSWSRYQRLIVLWPGTTQDSNLTYAIPEHAHYHIWQHPDVHIFDLKNKALYQ